MYQQPKKEIWVGREDPEDGAMGLRWHQKVELLDLTKVFPKAETYALLGFASDEGVRRNQGRVGAAKSPELIKKACASMAWHGALLADVGDVIVQDEDLESARRMQVDLVDKLLKNNAFPIVIGGGHETALGNYLALKNHYANIGVVNIDAHFDLRKPNPFSSSGTPFYEAYVTQPFNYLVYGIKPSSNTQALFQKAKEIHATYILADEILRNPLDALLQLKQFVDAQEVIYLTLDMDALDAAFVPGVSAPNAGGLFPHHVMEVIQWLKSSQKLVLMDLVECNPEMDENNRSMKMAAYFIHGLVDGFGRG